jgi:predicted helicase
MTNPDPFRTYLDEVRKKLATGMAKEHAYRGALDRLLQETGDGVQAINDSAWVECGAPDFIVLRDVTPLGYVEAKDIDTSLDDAQRSPQLKRYRESLSNLILTDYLEFRWYVEGEERDRARLATASRDGKVKSTGAGIDAVGQLLERFFAQEAPMLGSAKELAQRMASLARMIRDLIEEAYKLEGTEGRLHSQLAAFRETLIPELAAEQFADMYAQTITYGLFAARVRAPGGGQFTRQEAGWNLPPTNPFLRKLFTEIAGPDVAKEIAWAVDDLAHLLARADMSEVLRDFGKATKQEDPIVHFYETFLAHYNPQMRQRRGVYYTPEPVVSYIVRSIDHLLKTRCDRPLGLADERVMILDPACGTGTFLYFVIQEIHDTVVRERGEGAWNSYVREKLLPRIFGFELLMAPYAVAHMKLALQLQGLGYDFQGEERLGVYLTNSLEEAITKAETLGFARFISEEADAASEIKKEKPIMVVLGNPPYSVSSANKGKHIEQLMRRYKEAVRDERNIQPLSDDYIKFIRFAHDRIERTGYGIVGMITNHSYLSGLIHRGMREELLKSFDEIYVLNLHGSALIGEKAPDGGLDENVFDIRQGVAISLFVDLTDSGDGPGIRYDDLWGLREGKYSSLRQADIATRHWTMLEPVAPHFFFVPKELTQTDEYLHNWSVVDIFTLTGGGTKTRRDYLLVEFDRKTLVRRITDIAQNEDESELRSRYLIEDTSYWKLQQARRSISPDSVAELTLPYFYRPFDLRYVYYNTRIIERGDARWPLMRHMLRPNMALVTVRQLAQGNFRHVSVTSTLGDGNAISPSSREFNYYCPLYVYDENGKQQPAKRGGGATTLALFEPHTGYAARSPNFSPAFVSAVANKLVLDFVPDGRGDLQSTFGPEDVFNYMYAVFHCPTYRERYAEFLKIDFPRLPVTSDLGLFRALAQKGEELVALHLMESPALDHLITTFPVKGSNQVEKLRYVEETSEVHADFGGLVPGRVYINKTQYFQGVERGVWEFYVGGYQVLEKWLKDRKARTLSYDDVTHYGKVVVALKETIRLMGEIDELIPSWPIE